MNTRSRLKKDYGKLAVNERLLISGLLEQFDDAASRGDRRRMVTMLRRIDLPKDYASRWVDTLLEDQNFYRLWTDAGPAGNKRSL